jgi:hypothetical protein
MRKKYTYIPNEEIESLTTWEGKEVSGNKLLDGAYVRGKFAAGGDIDSEIERLEKALDNRYLPDSAKQNIVKKIFKLKGERVIHTQFEEEGFTYGHGGETSAMSMTDQMHEAKEILGARKWNSLSKEDKIKTVEYLIAKGEIESDEYAKGGGVKMPTPVQLVLKGKKTDIKGFNFKVYEFDGVKYALMTPMNGKQYVEKYLGKADGGMMAKGGKIHYSYTTANGYMVYRDGKALESFKTEEQAKRFVKELEQGKLHYADGGMMAKGGKTDMFYVGQSIIYPITNSTRLDKSVRNLFNKYAEKELVIEKIESDTPYNTAKVFVRSSGE